MSLDFSVHGLENNPTGATPPPQRTLNRLRQGSWKLRRPTRRGIIKWGAIAFGLFVLYVLFLWLTLPDISNPRALLADQSSVIVDRSGTELYRLFSEEDRTFIDGAQIPKYIKDAVISIEDARYYSRGCVDIRAIARAVLFLGGRGGASTITRQLARNALDLKKENILSRKLKELFLGCALENRYSKEELLDLYLNWIPFGQNAYGLEQASQTYFGRAASTLTLAQSAVLASLPQRPSYFSPFGKHLHTDVTNKALAKILDGTITSADQLRDEDIVIGLLGARIGTGSTTVAVGGRTDQVLHNMLTMGMITQQEYDQALRELPAITFKKSRENIRAPHFVLWVKSLVDELLQGSSDGGILDRGGLRIETTLDWNLQQVAESAVARQAEDLKERFGAKNAALVAIDPLTRDVLAYVGNTDYDDEEDGGKIDMARAARQPGSTFKPFVYAAAFGYGYGPATVLYDVPTKFGEDEPQNYDGHFLGLIDARHALAGSRNIPAIKAFYLLPSDNREEEILELVSRLGAPTPRLKKAKLREADAQKGIPADKQFSYGYPLAIGAAETPLVEMVQGYASITAGGTAHPLVAITKILDRNGNILYEPEKSDVVEVLDPRIAYQVTSMLSDVSARPNEYWQTILSVPGYEAAAKTGTSNKCLERFEAGPQKGQCKDRKPSDVWTIGATPALVAGVWVGNADGSGLASNAESLITAAPIWKNFMIGAHPYLEARKDVPAPQKSFPQPDGLVFPQISRLSGQLPTECTPIALRSGDVFLEDAPPTLPDPACAELEIDKVTGLLASPSCPAEAREKGVFLTPHSILADRWPLWEKGVQEWAQHQMDNWNARPDHSGSLLPLPLAPQEACDLSLTPDRLHKPSVRITFPTNGENAPAPAFRPRIELGAGSVTKEVRYSIDGKSVLIVSGTGATDRATLTLPRSVNVGGTHTLEVTVTDRYFNQASDRSTFRLVQDSEAPNIRFTSPSGSLTIPSGHAMTITADAGDRDGGLKYVQFFLGTRLLTTKPTAPYELHYDFAVKPGNFTLRAVATDFAGNEAEDVIDLTVTP